MNNKYFKTVLVLFCFALLLFISPEANAQCAMCRTSIENNVSNGGSSIASGLNTGILYLLVMPYLAFGVLAYLWYKNSVKNRTQQEKLAKVLRASV